MKKSMKIVVGVIAAVLIISAAFWGSIIYRSNHKVATIDTSVSPDRAYEPVLPADGEAEAENMNETTEITPQTAYADKSESQEDVEPTKKDKESIEEADDIDTIEEVNQYMIPEQSFDIALDDWGEVTFVSCKPLSWHSYQETSFFLVRDNQILYQFPYHVNGFGGLFDSVAAVAFRDINDDGKDDIVIIIHYITGAGPQGVIPRPAVRIYLAGENEFILAEEMETDIMKNIWENDMTIEMICNYLQHKNYIADNPITVYPSYDSSWTEDELINAVNERSGYYRASAYYSEITDYWENVREVRDISNVIEPLFETDKKYYTKEEFENEPMLVIHLAKNEIYARHGYIFANEDLFNYFMGCIWYSPTSGGADFVLNEYELANLGILADLDTY